MEACRNSSFWFRGKADHARSYAQCVPIPRHQSGKMNQLHSSRLNINFMFVNLSGMCHSLSPPGFCKCHAECFVPLLTARVIPTLFCSNFLGHKTPLIIVRITLNH